MNWKGAIFPSVVATIIATALLAGAGKVSEVNFKEWFGIKRIESGEIAIIDNKDFEVKFKTPYKNPPHVTFGSIYSEHSKGEAFATMTSKPTNKIFEVRLVRIGAGGSKPGEWGRGIVHWVAVGN